MADAVFKIAFEAEGAEDISKPVSASFAKAGQAVKTSESAVSQFSKSAVKELITVGKKIDDMKAKASKGISVSGMTEPSGLISWLKSSSLEDGKKKILEYKSAIEGSNFGQLLKGGLAVGSAAASTAVAALTAAMGAAIGTAGAYALAISASLETSNKLRNEKIDLGFAFGGAKQGGEMHAWLSDLENRSMSTFEEMTASAQRFARAGFGTEEIKKTILAMEDLKATGNLFAASAFENVITTVKQYGEFGGRQVKELLSSGMFKTSEIAKAFGASETATKDELAKFIEAKKIGAEQAQSVLLGLVKSRVDAGGNLGDTASKRASGDYKKQLLNIGNTIEGFTENLATNSAVSSFLGNLNGALTTLTPRIEAFIGSALQPMLDWLSSLDQSKIEGFLSKTMDLAESIGGPLVRGVSWVFTKSSALFELLDSGSGSFDKISMFAQIAGYGIATLAAITGAAVATLILPFTLPAILVYGAISAFNSLKDTVSNYVSAFVELVPQWIDAGKNMVDGLIGGMVDRFASAKSAVSELAQDAISTFKNLLGIHSPSRVFFQLGGYMTDGLTMGLGDGSRDVSSATRELASASINGAASLPSSTLSGGLSNSIVISVNVDGSGGDSEALGKSIAEQIRIEMTRIMEGMSASSGVYT